MSDCPLRNPAPADARQGPARSTKQSKELVRRYYAACNAGDFAAIFACLHPDCIHHSRLSEHPKDGVAFTFHATFAAFENLHWTIEELIAEGERVATLVLIEGTHVGDCLGAPRTGRRIRVHSVDVATVRDGLFVERRGVLDELHLLAQVGVVPEALLAQT